MKILLFSKPSVICIDLYLSVARLFSIHHSLVIHLNLIITRILFYTARVTSFVLMSHPSAPVSLTPVCPQDHFILKLLLLQLV